MRESLNTGGVSMLGTGEKYETKEVYNRQLHA